MSDNDSDLEYGPNPAPDDACARKQALAALQEWPEVTRNAILAHLAAAGPSPRDWWRPDSVRPVGGWAYRAVWFWGTSPFAAEGRKLPQPLAGYLRVLDQAVTGENGAMLAHFLQTFVVDTKIQAFAYLADATGRDSSRSEAEDWRPGANRLHLFSVGYRASMQGSGDHRRCLCPFHEERTPSFAYSLTSRQWHCYGCGQTDTHWSMVARLFRLHDREAVDLLRRWVGQGPPPWPLPSPGRNQAMHVRKWFGIRERSAA